MKRRSFIAGLGSAAAWPMIASGQQVPRRIGVLMPTTESDPIERSWLAAFVEELARLGWVNGRTIAIDYRWGGGDVAKYRIFAKELVDLRPDALLVAGTPAVAPALEATHSIPIVFTLVGDPVGSGFVESLSRPGGNITGFIPIEPLTASKWLELLRAAAPQVRQIAFLYNPDTAPYAGAFFRHAEAAAAVYAVNLIAAPVHNDMEVENVLGMLAQEPNGGLIVLPEAFTQLHREWIISQAARHHLPAIYGDPSFVESGALITYFNDYRADFRAAAGYVNRILKGEKPGDLAVQAPTRFELIVNVKAAKAIGLVIPERLLVQADKIIE